MHYIILLLTLFLLPLFPFSLITNRLLSRLSTRTLFILQGVCLGSGLFLLRQAQEGKNEIVALLAAASMLLYAFRMLGTDHLREFGLYLFIFLASFGWLWFAMGGDMLHYLAMELPLFISFIVLVVSVYSRFEVVHRYSVNGLGSVKPYFSTLFILTLLALAFTPLFSISVLLDEALHLISFFHIAFVGLAWFFLNWAIVRVIEWLIFLKPSRHLEYPKLTKKEIFLSSFFLILGFLFFIIYAAGSLS